MVDVFEYLMRSEKFQSDILGHYKSQYQDIKCNYNIFRKILFSIKQKYSLKYSHKIYLFLKNMLTLYQNNLVKMYIYFSVLSINCILYLKK